MIRFLPFPVALFCMAVMLHAEEKQSGDFKYISDGSAITITGYTGDASDIKIPAKIAGLTVQVIGKSVFMNNFKAIAISIPDGVTEIQEAAFAGCRGVAKMRIPETLINIGKMAFSDCQKLTQLTIPANVKLLGSEAFSRCTSLTTVTFEGNAPALDNVGNASALFWNSPPNFTIRYYKGSSGFTTPQWNGYKSIEIDPATEPFDWTSNDNKTLKAKFVRLDGESVVVQTEDGKERKIPVTRLSPASGALAKKLGESK